MVDMMTSDKSVPLSQNKLYKNEEFSIRVKKIAKRKEWLKGLWLWIVIQPEKD